MQILIISTLCDLLADQLGQEVKGAIYEERRHGAVLAGCHDGREPVHVDTNGIYSSRCNTDVFE